MIRRLDLAQRWRPMVARPALGLLCLLAGADGGAGRAAAQEAPPTAERTQVEQDLTEGLLDLLTEPNAEASKPREAVPGNIPPTQTAPGGAAPAPDKPPLGGARSLGAQDLGTQDLGGGEDLGGEDLGASQANPLAEVRLGMLTAAGWLRDQSAPDKTEQLQRDIVARLDQLIDDLNQRSPRPTADRQSPPPSEPPQPSEPQAEAEQSVADKGAGETRAAGDAARGQEPQADGKAGSQGQPAPGAPERKGVVVELNDPTALKRSAWGNLPDRVREQMQSRMVERFLPAYREEIEAYYRALSR